MDSTLAGSDNDYFRFSVAGSYTDWNLRHDGRGTYLARLHYDAGRQRTDVNSTEYFDPRSEYDSLNNAAGVMRIHGFGAHVDSTRTAMVSIEIMRPDESAGGTANFSRPVAITRCSSDFEGTNTYKNADQYVGIGCSARGPNIRYSWEFEPGVWTPETADTLYDFAGYSIAVPSTRQVRLKVRDVSPGGSTSITPPTTISVVDAVLTASGPADVWDKLPKTYKANAPAQWFERFNPQLSWTTITSMYVDSIQRIWPAGNYTVDVRSEDLRTNTLRRGKQTVNVSDLSLQATSSSAPKPELDWSFFGGGPWLSWGTSTSPSLIRAYELMGMHSAPSRFTNRSWLAAGEAATDVFQGFQVSMTRGTINVSDALVVHLAVAPPTGIGSYAFGFSLDPDLGTSAADDESGYDAARGLVYARDNSGAVGYLLLKAGQNALRSVDQFGTRRFAPMDLATAWQLHRTQGSRLQSGRSDVQFVLSAAPQTSPATYTVVMIRGTAVGDLQRKADEILKTLP